MHQQKYGLSKCHALPHNLVSLTSVLFVCWALSTSVLGAERPTPIKVGQMAGITLDGNASKDFVISLPKGAYRLVWDARRTDGQSSNIIAMIKLLKPNGVVIDPSLLRFNIISVEGRVGAVYQAVQPILARLRVENGRQPLQMWLTVVPAAQTTRVPFGFGVTVTPARIASENGVGGTLAPGQSIYHSITLPPGKWSISLGLSLPAGESSNLQGQVDLLDALGFTTQDRLVSLNQIDTQARQEGILTITKAKPILLRVTNRSSSKTYTYDVTIEKAS